MLKLVVGQLVEISDKILKLAFLKSYIFTNMHILVTLPAYLVLLRHRIHDTADTYLVTCVLRLLLVLVKIFFTSWWIRSATLVVQEWKESPTTFRFIGTPAVSGATDLGQD